MKIFAIDSVNFGNMQKTVKTLAGAGATAVLGSEFVKGLSKPSKEVDEDIFIKANDDTESPCDECFDASYEASYDVKCNK